MPILSNFPAGAKQTIDELGAQSKIAVSGILKGDGSGGVTAAEAGTDYVEPQSFTSHVRDTTVHVTAEERAAWNEKTPASDTTPSAPGTASAGTEEAYARGDHVHPHDDTKQAKITASGILKGDGNGGVTMAEAGTDYQTPLEDWDKAVLLKNVTVAFPVVKDWKAVCYGSGKFVAVANNTDIAVYSTDGITWAQTTLPVSANWYSVCYGNGKFVAVARNSDVAAYSTDGINWTQTTMPVSKYWNFCCYGDGKFVAISSSNSAVAAYSTDGVNWTQTAMPASARWSSVCYGDGKFVATADGSAIAAYSTDGITWTQTTMPASKDWSSVCYGNGRFVSVAWNSNAAAYSSDGMSWASTTMPASTNWISVCYGNGKFVAVARAPGATAAYSSDGITWTQAALPDSSLFWFSVCYGDGKFIAVPYLTTYIAYSTDGINWVHTIPIVTDPAGTDISTDLKVVLGAQTALTADEVQSAWDAVTV